MHAEQIAQWESAAQAAAEQLCAMLKFPSDLALTVVAADDADGTNSLDEDFVARLLRREHLNDQFLADI
jgi:hypothetical protein